MLGLHGKATCRRFNSLGDSECILRISCSSLEHFLTKFRSKDENFRTNIICEQWFGDQPFVRCDLE